MSQLLAGQPFRESPPGDRPLRALLQMAQRRTNASGGAGGGTPTDAEPTRWLRELITGALHVGSLQPGDRLPSIRQTAELLGLSTYACHKAYSALEAEGLVEKRERSGMYVATMQGRTEPGLPETGNWLVEVLTQACEHQLKIPQLPDLIRRWTTAVPLRCACIDDCLDHRTALCLELDQQFGIQSSPVTLRDVPPAAGAAAPAELSGELAEADVLITTSYHAGPLRALAAALGKPLLVATLSPSIVRAVLSRLRQRELTVICVDGAFGERLRSLHGGAYRDRVRVVLADDAAGVWAVDRSEPVLLTPAARHRLKHADFRLIAPLHPLFSLEFARKVAETLVRFHLAASRA